MNDFQNAFPDSLAVEQGKFYAHSGNFHDRWHFLAAHLGSVAERAQAFAQGLPWEGEAGLAGLYHDLGKYGDLFQARLRGEGRGLDHWSAGAWTVLLAHRSIAAALAIQGHHIGLQQGDLHSLKQLDLGRLARDHPLGKRLTASGHAELKERLRLDGLSPVAPVALPNATPAVTLARMLEVRLLFSALVDADFLDTEAHFQGDARGKRERLGGPLLEPERALAGVLAHLESLRAGSVAHSQVAAVRDSLLTDCLRSAEAEPGLFTLTAPTGSGKTLAMLAFALRHAVRHGLRRVVVVIPYLSIIEQTVAIYREILSPIFGGEYVLEDHSLADRGQEENQEDAEGTSAALSAARRRGLLAENWDAPLVVTTSVQLLESLFSNRASTCRKLHRLTKSVILFDEVQTLPAALAVPTLTTLAHLVRAGGGTLLFATATQPAFDSFDEQVRAGCPSGWRPCPVVEDPHRLFVALQRVEVTWRSPDQPLAWEILAAELRHHPQVLCIVNLKRHARALSALLLGEHTFHLSTNLCPAHRKEVLAEVRSRLKQGLPVLLVATQCVEAGVDLDFPVVFRAMAPLEAIIQAAGRCNREGRLARGRMEIFVPEDEKYPLGGGYAQAASMTKVLLKEKGELCMTIDDPDFIREYYRRLYNLSDPANSGRTKALMNMVEAGSFPEVAKAYRLIDQDTINVVVPYKTILSMPDSGLNREWIRQMRPLTIGLHRPGWDALVWDILAPVAAAGGPAVRQREDEWFLLVRSEHYHPVLGFDAPDTLNLWIA
ncbi:MAG: CRISPR-associated helicase Cas3' [Magnetococcus sp. XQGC-1]